MYARVSCSARTRSQINLPWCTRILSLHTLPMGLTWLHVPVMYTKWRLCCTYTRHVGTHNTEFRHFICIIIYIGIRERLIQESMRYSVRFVDVKTDFEEFIKFSLNKNHFFLYVFRNQWFTIRWIHFFFFFFKQFISVDFWGLVYGKNNYT